MTSRIDRNREWRLALARATSAFLLGVTLSPLAFAQISEFDNNARLDLWLADPEKRNEVFADVVAVLDSGEPLFTPPLSLPKNSEPEKKDGESLLDALTKGKPELSFRYRYENVEDDALEEAAHASTLRTALGYRTLPYR